MTDALRNLLNRHLAELYVIDGVYVLKCHLTSISEFRTDLYYSLEDELSSLNLNDGMDVFRNHK